MFAYLHSLHIAVLDPAGLIALKERNLLVLITGLSMIVIVPVFVLTIFVAWKYREGNTKAKHSPEWDRNWMIESVWWGVPAILIIIFSVIIWKSSADLDPFKPITAVATAQGGSATPLPAPITIEVVALDWKWLFLYPAQHIATVNFFEFPENTPVNFVITSDAPMNSFWIPQLGSQIYAMPSMSTQLHLIASSTGTYYGSSANISGVGFAGMNFTAQSVSAADFAAWVQSVQQTPSELTVDAYNGLAEPSTDTPVEYFSWNDDSLYDKVLMKDMMEESEVATDSDEMSDTNSMDGMNMGGMDMSNMNMNATDTIVQPQ